MDIKMKKSLKSHNFDEINENNKLQNDKTVIEFESKHLTFSHFHSLCRTTNQCKLFNNICVYV